MSGNDDRRGSEWRLAEQVTAEVLAVYADVFGSADRLFSAAGAALPSLAVDDLAKLTSRAIHDLAARDAEISGRRPLGRTDWRVILYSLSGARTLREAITRCSECFEAIDWRCGRMTLRTRADCAELELAAERPGQGTALACLVDLFGFSEIHGLLGWLIGRPLPVGHAWLNHAPAIFAALNLRNLPFALRLSEGWTGFDFNAALLDYPVIRSADELDRRPVNNMLFATPTDETERSGATDRVRRLALASLRDNYKLPVFGEIAAVIGVSEATLRRRLLQDGTSYRQVRESCRRELALDLLRRTRMSIEDIALRLDFCDSDAFRQAFKNWTGQPPSAYRRESG
ncbi:helix-turn-helix domain-containing protein [Sphingobium sp. CAP-1]|uniref:helix-turn-helix domain-containing protein n=1 Tax=Sphingobium sp. CAP-1 TaxID=2676077 RepID=UPI0012BB3848|nr:AraC family transcriptional regulator [Sphingobium sp. CAP-1]QGP81115.1 helix-turn-helix domain-containing protein [Sphingobium sp. CAP-1]